jgi:hypothetical protein
MRGAIPPLPQYVFMEWCFVKHRDNFTFYLYTSRSVMKQTHTHTHTHTNEREIKTLGDFGGHFWGKWMCHIWACKTNFVKKRTLFLSCCPGRFTGGFTCIFIWLLVSTCVFQETNGVWMETKYATKTNDAEGHILTNWSLGRDARRR